MLQEPDKSPNVEKKSCFVVCPIGMEGTATRRHADWLLHEIIEHVIDHHFTDQFRVTRSDKIVEPGMIDAQIIAHLLDDDLVIADMTELNPNAFYEMGIRHMQQLPIIHMYKKDQTTIPFDVKLFRAIAFDYADPVDLRAARSELRKAISATLKEGYIPDNPVTRARGFINIPQSATSETILIQQQIEEINHRLARIDGSVTRVSERRFGVSAGSIAINFDKRYSAQERQNATKLLTSLAERFFEGCSVHGDHASMTVDLATDTSQQAIEEFTELAYGIGILKSIVLPPSANVFS